MPRPPNVVTTVAPEGHDIGTDLPLGKTEKPEPSGDVKVRVLKRGANRISKGYMEAFQDVTYPKDAEFVIPADVAKALEDRDYVEILK